MVKYHKINDVKFSGDRLYVNIDGKKHTFLLSSVSKRLLKATDVEKNRFEISSSGYGIHWPLIDEDLSIDGLLKLSSSSSRKKKKVTSD